MRVRYSALRPTLLALTFTALLAVPAAAQSGAQATIAMQPESAAPGTAVEVAGSGFPTEMSVALQLMTQAGTFDLATAATARDGTFRQFVVLPALPVNGGWELEAQAADGTIARLAFEATPPAAAPAEIPAAAPASAPATETVVVDSTTSDGVFLVIIGILLGMVSTGVLYAWRMLRDERVQPGMGQAADVIWSDGRADEQAEPTATTEPFWKAARTEDDSAGREVPRRDVSGASEREASASA